MKFKSLFCSLLLLWCLPVFAEFSLEVTDPSLITQVKELDKGDAFVFLDNDQNERYYDVRFVSYSYRKDSNDNEVMFATFEPNNEGHFEADSSGTVITYKKNSAENKKNGNGSSDSFLNSLSGALGSAATAALQQAFFEALPHQEQIKKAMKAINALQKEIDQFNQKVKEVRIEAGNKTLAISVQLTEDAQKLDLPEFDESKVDDYELAIKQAGQDLENFKWSSEDPEFIKEAEAIRQRLLKFKVKDSLDEKFREVATASLDLADTKSAIGKKYDSDFYLSVAKTATDILFGIDPFTGTARSIYESITGVNIITGETLSKTERFIAVAGIFTAGYVGKAYGVFKSYKLLRSVVVKVNKKSLKIFDSLKPYFRSTGHGFTLGQGSKVRKINFSSNFNKNWGLTKKHLHKHFFGNKERYSLRHIDPGGNPDQWMQNMMSLMQKKPNSINSEAMLQIIETFPKADGSGFYKMGVKLKERADGSFDLVTILTNQKRM